ncbi:unnamed protein product [Clonostachys byssicola]|uniref:Uncharacterized protein n=1 Tax=Clonostachys byssicola TaxID=160290 RepID=A0A9N9XW54_9HYPO|nr:unnamed protein product [Clonostachys byssicola]
MEPESSAIGVVSLAGLFNACLGTVARIDANKEFRSDSQALAAQFHAIRLLFERWGRAVGLEKGQVSVHHHPVLEDQSVCLVVAEIISMIRNIVVGLETLEDAAATKPSGLTRRPAISSAPLAPKRQKLASALRGNESLAAEVETVDGLVRKLYELIPTGDSSKAAEINATNSDAFRKLQAGTESWTKEIQSTLKKIEQDNEAETRRELHMWIAADIPSDVYEDLKETRAPGTCNWILDRKEFRGWLKSNENSSVSPVLWVNAIAGCGKTVLCARVVEHLSETLNTPIAQFFLSSQNASRDDPYLAIRSWIVQVIGQNADAFNLVRTKRLSQHEQTASRMTIISLFQEISQTIPSCTFVLDGLDECNWVGPHHQNHNSIKAFLQIVGETMERSTSRFILFSRNDESIRNSLHDSLARGFNEIRVMARDVYDDIVSYSRTIVNEKISNKPQDLKENISQQLADQCDGQFLWVRLQATKLQKISNKFQLQRDISNTPAGLGQLYEREWESINTNPDVDTERALSLLKWAAFSIRPLSVSEIAVAVLIKPGCPGVPVEELLDPGDGVHLVEDIKAHSGSLLEIIADNKSTKGAQNTEDIRSMMVHITHFSVKEFILTSLLVSDVSLKRNSAISISYEQLQHSALAEACLQYIFHPHVWKMHALPKEAHGFETAFLDYAAGSWYTHANIGSGNAEIVNLVNDFFSDTTGCFDEWRRWINTQAYNRGVLSQTPNEESQANRLPYAISMRLRSATEYLLTAGNYEINGRGYHGETPLIASCRTGQIEVVNRLLSFGADMSLPSLEGYMPLCIAVDQGYIDIARVLLEAGADANIRNIEETGRNPLIWASSHGHPELAKLLVDNGADVSLPDKSGNTPLLVAVQEGHLQIAQLLVDSGAGTTASSNGGHSPLFFACMNGNEPITELLIDKGVGLPGMVDEHGSALHAAASGGHMEVAKLLLNKGAQVDCFDEAMKTSIYNAVNGGHFGMTELLIKEGADLSLRPRSSESLLHAAARNGHLEIAHLLIGAKRDLIFTRDGVGDSPLISALYAGHLELARLLLEEEPTLIPAADDQGWTPLHTATSFGHLELCELLLSKGGNPSCQTDEGNTPLHITASEGFLDVCLLLLGKGARPSCQNKGGNTPLHIAVREGHLEVANSLLEKGADLNIVEKNGWAPINIAAVKGHLGVTKLLLGKGANLAIAEKTSGRTPLLLAASQGHLEMVKLLIEKGADLNTSDDDGRTPLLFAAGRGHLEMVRLLLEKGASINTGDKTWTTPLHAACHSGNIEVVGFLLGQPGIHPNTLNLFGRPPLCDAARRGQTDVAKALLCNNARADISDGLGLPPLFYALRNGQSEVVQLLLPKTPGWKNWKDGLGRDFVWWAHHIKSPRITQLLVDHDADIKSCHSEDGARDVSSDPPPPLSRSRGFCDCCIGSVLRGTPLYFCSICWAGQFCICIECFEGGLRCFDDSHELTLN